MSHGGQFGGCLVVSGETWAATTHGHASGRSACFQRAAVSELLGEELLQNLAATSSRHVKVLAQSGPVSAERIPPDGSRRPPQVSGVLAAQLCSALCLGEFRQGLRIPQEGLLCGLGLACPRVFSIGRALTSGHFAEGLRRPSAAGSLPGAAPGTTRSRARRRRRLAPRPPGFRSLDQELH